MERKLKGCHPERNEGPAVFGTDKKAGHFPAFRITGQGLFALDLYCLHDYIFGGTVLTVLGN
jgi:hypothetical protein